MTTPAHRITTIVAGLALLATSLLTSGCLTPEPAPTTPTVVLFDISQSQADDVAGQFATVFDLAYDWNADLSLIPVGDSLGASESVFSGVVGPRGESESQTLVFRSQDRTGFVNGALEWLDTVSRTSSTDVIAGLISAADSLPPSGGHLVVVSDGISTAPELSLLTQNLSTREAIESLVDDLVSRGLVPDLEQVDVVWLGMGKSNVAAQLPTGAAQQIRRFWVAYLATAGATVEVTQ